MHAVSGEFGEALAEQGSDQVLGPREVGLEDREFEVQVLVLVHVLVFVPIGDGGVRVIG
jgi:hypothetical protein